MMFKTIIFAIVITAIAAEDDRPTLRDILQLPENTPYPEDKPCTPRAQFKYYCNTCKCSSTGFGASCSRMGCPPGIFEEDGTLTASKVKREVSVGPENTPYPEDKPCTPRAQFKYYCNTCTCSSTGIGASCSRMGCPPGIFKEDGSLIAPKVKREVSVGPENTPYPEDKPCTPRAQFKYYCNTCTCSSTGIGASCSRMGCPPGIFEEDGTLTASKAKREVSVGPENTPYPEDKPCSPRAQFKYYCNSCTCSSTGIGASCSRMGCPPGIFEEDGTLIASKAKREVSVGPENTPYPEDKPCTPRAQFKYYCNTCTCSSTGIGASCSRMGCPPGIFEEDGTLTASKAKREVSVGPENTPYPEDKPCTPHAHFKYYCNTCTCSSTGVGAECTKMGCPPGIFNEDGSLKEADASKIERENEEDSVDISSYPRDRPCSPSASFKYYCNSCMCQPNGAGAACTRMGCKPGMYNEDGSLRASEPKNTSYPADKPCTPRAEFKYYCNRCTCSLSGVGASCTRMDCPPGIFNEDGSLRVVNEPKVEAQTEVLELPSDGSCTPGKVYKSGCNECQCYKKNLPLCTLKSCFEEPAIEHKPAQNWGPYYVPGSPCEPETLFYSECNECKCLKNGKGASCTLMACDPASRPSNE